MHNRLQNVTLICLNSFLREERVDQNVFQNINWDQLYVELLDHHLLLFFCENMDKEIPLPWREKFGLQHEYLNQKKAKQISELKTLVTRFNDKNIQYVLYKGRALEFYLDEENYHRSCSDTDLVIQRNDIDECYSLLKEYNYDQFIIWHNPTMRMSVLEPPKLKHWNEFHEYQFENQKDLHIFNNAIELQLELSGILPEMLGDFLESVVEFDHQGTITRTFDAIHTFLLLCLNTFKDSEKRTGCIQLSGKVRNYFEIALFLKNNQKLDLTLIARLATNYNIQNRVFCVLKNTHYLFGNIDSTLLNELQDTFSKGEGYCERTGSNYLWTSTIDQRLFDKDMQIKDFERALIERNFSSANMHYKAPYKITNNRQQRIFNENKYGYDIHYQFSQKNDVFIINLVLDPCFVECWNQYKILLDFHCLDYVDNVVDRNEKVIYFEFFDEKVFCIYENEAVACTLTSIEDLSVCIEVEFKYSRILKNTTRRNLHHWYQLYLTERIMDNYYQLIGIKYENDLFGIIQHS